MNVDLELLKFARTEILGMGIVGPRHGAQEIVGNILFVGSLDGFEEALVTLGDFLLGV